MERYIRDQLKLFHCQTEELSFTAQTPIGPKPMRNFLLRIPGTGSRPVVISGHYDTKILPNFTGANDGGSSAGLLMELARVLCNAGKQRDPVWVLWLDGEQKKYANEVGTMNIFFVIDGKLITPPTDGTILEGITRESVIPDGRRRVAGRD